VRGPQSKIKPKDVVRTSPIDISDLEKDSEFEADLILPKPDLRFAAAQGRARLKVFLAAK
jgi:hypothetical protein